ncbi:MAG TPA: hypothetical protein VFI24_21880 [Pyrinomonadaceae bacterium]|nr:hypothetical protein [Pyrinomonadaceae bacterium]
MTDRHSHHLLGSSGFLIGLLLLLVNDFVFKEQFHNVFTGKLSDFAGLFVFPLFWTVFFPRKKLFIFVGTALLFVFWKSVYSQFLIEEWNSLPFFGVQRTVDYSDLSALLILPLSYWYSKTSFGVHVPHRLIYLIAVVSMFAFTATQFSHKESFNNQYQFQSSKKELLERMSRLPTDEVSKHFWNGNAFNIGFDSCNGRATVTVQEQGNQTVITLQKMDFRCPSAPRPDAMRQYFEKEFIDKLREGPAGKSRQILYISSASQ